MFEDIKKRIQPGTSGAFDFEVESLNAMEMIFVQRLVFMLRRIAIQGRLKITFTDYQGKHYHLEWEPSEVPAMEFRWPQSN